MRLFFVVFCLLLSFLVGCRNLPQLDPPVVLDSLDRPAVPLQNAPTFLQIPTYDGSGQVTEPNVVSFDLPWHGFKYWMAFSPYPFGNSSRENPSIAGSNDGVTWQVPLGLMNPLALPTTGFLADASIFYDSKSDQLWVYYIGVPATRDSVGVFGLISPDGVHWKIEGVLFTVPAFDALSPTVAKVDGGYYMWTVNASAAGCTSTSSAVEYRTSNDGVKWSNSYTTNLGQPGYVVWHINMLYVAPKQEYWAVVAAYPPGTECVDTSIFFANSQDGINWNTYPKAILTPGNANAWDSESIYRSSLLFDAATNRVLLWYSATDQSEAWHVGLTKGDLDALFEWLKPNAAALR